MVRTRTEPWKLITGENCVRKKSVRVPYRRRVYSEIVSPEGKIRCNFRCVGKGVSERLGWDLKKERMGRNKKRFHEKWWNRQIIDRGTVILYSRYSLLGMSQTRDDL